MADYRSFKIFPVAMLAVATMLSGCDSMPWAKERQKEVSNERRTPALNPGGVGGGSSYNSQPQHQQYAGNNFQRGFGNNDTPRSAPAVQVSNADFPSVPQMAPRQQYAASSAQQYASVAPAAGQYNSAAQPESRSVLTQPAQQYASVAPAAGYVQPQQQQPAAYPMQNTPVVAENLQPPMQQQPQYALASPPPPVQPQYAPQQQAYAPMQQYNQQPATAQQYANVAPAVGYAPQQIQPTQPQQYASAAPVPAQAYASPVSVQQQSYAQAQPQPEQPKNDASFWRDFYAYSQPQSQQNQGYPNLASVPQAPPHRNLNQYQQEIQSLQYQGQQTQQQAYAPVPSPQPQAPQQQQPQYAPQQAYAPLPPSIDVPAAVAAPGQMAQQPYYGNYAPAPAQQAVQQIPQYPSAIPLPPGSYVFSTSDGRQITLTPPPRPGNETL